MIDIYRYSWDGIKALRRRERLRSTELSAFAFAALLTPCLACLAVLLVYFVAIYPLSLAFVVPLAAAVVGIVRLVRAADRRHQEEMDAGHFYWSSGERRP